MEWFKNKYFTAYNSCLTEPKLELFPFNLSALVYEYLENYVGPLL